MLIRQTVAPVVLPVVASVLEARGAYTPLQIFTGGVTGAWYDASDLTTLFQDSAGTTPVTADGDPVGRWLDKSGGGRHLAQATGENRPTYRTSGGLHWIETNGTTQFLSAAYIQSAYPVMVLSAALCAAATSGGGIASVNQGDTQYKALSENGTTTYRAHDRGTGNLADNGPASSAGSAHVILGDFRTGTFEAVVDKVSNGTTVNTNTFGTSANILVGKIRPAGLFFSGRIYQVMVVNATLTTEQLAPLWTYLGAKCGAAL